MLITQRKRILFETSSFEEVLSLMHQLSGRFNVLQIIDRAEHVHEYFKSLPISSIPYELHYLIKEPI